MVLARREASLSLLCSGDGRFSRRQGASFFGNSLESGDRGGCGLLRKGWVRLSLEKGGDRMSAYAPVDGSPSTARENEAKKYMVEADHKLNEKSSWFKSMMGLADGY